MVKGWALDFKQAIAPSTATSVDDYSDAFVSQENQQPREVAVLCENRITMQRLRCGYGECDYGLCADLRDRREQGKGCHVKHCRSSLRKQFQMCLPGLARCLVGPTRARTDLAPEKCAT